MLTNEITVSWHVDARILTPKAVNRLLDYAQNQVRKEATEGKAEGKLIFEIFPGFEVVGDWTSNLCIDA